MPKSRARKIANRGAPHQALGPRRSHRPLIMIAAFLAAFSMIALVVAGFLNYSAPTPTTALPTPSAIVVSASRPGTNIIIVTPVPQTPHPTP